MENDSKGCDILLYKRKAANMNEQTQTMFLDLIEDHINNNKSSSPSNAGTKQHIKYSHFKLPHAEYTQ